MMSSRSPLRAHHRIGQPRTGRLKSLGGRIVAAAGRTLQGLFNNNPPLIPIRVRVSARQRLDRSRPQ
jgi:hypothetical protein